MCIIIVLVYLIVARALLLDNIRSNHQNLLNRVITQPTMMNCRHPTSECLRISLSVEYSLEKLLNHVEVGIWRISDVRGGPGISESVEYERRN